MRLICQIAEYAIIKIMCLLYLFSKLKCKDVFFILVTINNMFPVVQFIVKTISYDSCKKKANICACITSTKMIFKDVKQTQEQIWGEKNAKIGAKIT